MIAPPLSLPLARLGRTPRVWIPVLAWAALALVSALVLRRTGASATAGALQAIFGGFALPLLAFAMVGAVLGGDGLTRAARPFVAFGASPPRVALATVSVAVVVTALVGAVVAGAVAAIAHGSSDPALATDAVTSAWVAALGGAAYAALFAFGASFGKRGGGRAVFLVLDWVLGSSSGAAGILTPRAHVRSLLGGDAVMTMPGRASALALLGLLVLYAAAATARTRRT